ncbi:hypothetical protein GCM10020331_074130 [Ectobacillus funiculus]
MAEATTQEGAYKDTPTQTRSTPTIEADMPTGFVSSNHSSLNDLTGWGAIDSPDWKAVHERAKDIVFGTKSNELQRGRRFGSGFQRHSGIGGTS